MTKTRKTRQAKTTIQKASQGKRKPLKSLDKNLANGKSKSQKPKQAQPSRRSTRQKNQEEKKAVYKDPEESSADESPVQSQSPVRENSPSDQSSGSSLNSRERDAVVEAKVSNKAATTKTNRLARPLDADFEQVRDWRSSSVIDY